MTRQFHEDEFGYFRFENQKMRFSQAFDLMLDQSKKARREGWQSKKTYVRVLIPHPLNLITEPILVIDTREAQTNNPNYKKGVAPYIPSQCDLFTEDWIVFD